MKNLNFIIFLTFINSLIGTTEQAPAITEEKIEKSEAVQGNIDDAIEKLNQQIAQAKDKNTIAGLETTKKTLESVKQSIATATQQAAAQTQANGQAKK